MNQLKEDSAANGIPLFIRCDQCEIRPAVYFGLSKAQYNLCEECSDLYFQALDHSSRS
jgi:uncharacterized paraquat-inducible protein A